MLKIRDKAYSKYEQRQLFKFSSVRLPCMRLHLESSLSQPQILDTEDTHSIYLSHTVFPNKEHSQILYNLL